MAKAEIKTKKTEADVEEFLDSVEDGRQREDSKKISAMMAKATGAKPKMWGASIVGFGERTIKSESGREVDWLEIGFAPRKANLSLYLNIGEGWDEKALSKLGKHKTGKGCLYIKKLEDVDEKILEKMIERSIENIRR